MEVCGSGDRPYTRRVYTSRPRGPRRSVSLKDRIRSSWGRSSLEIEDARDLTKLSSRGRKTNGLFKFSLTFRGVTESGLRLPEVT